MTDVTNIADLRQLARRRVPKAIFDYVDRGSYDELTLDKNRQALSDIELRQRVLIDVAKRDCTSDIFDKRYSLPLAIAPTGLTGLVHADGEIEGAKAAEKFGIPFTLSTLSICSIEQVANETRQPFWFQLYMMQDKVFMAELIDRAKKAGCSALVLTADLQVQGQRHQDIKNGLTVPPKITLKNILDTVSKPLWCAQMLGAKSRSFGNLVEYQKGKKDLTTLAKWIKTQFDTSLSWEDVDWVKSKWNGDLILKGILDETDAAKAFEHGADMIVVSNHGGRQLDGAPASIHALKRIAEAIGDSSKIVVDGGIQSGQDLYKCLAYGAKFCLIGKAFLYGLGAGGEDGVRQCLDLIAKELDVTMALTGVNNISQINKKCLW